jgi:anti-anti-sigma factor
LGLVILNLEGRLDVTTSGDLHKRVELELKAGRRFFLFNLSAVSFIDSMGMAAMLKLLKQVRQANGDIRIVSSSTAATRRILYLTRFDKVFDIYTDTEEALRNFGELPEAGENSARDEPALQPSSGGGRPPVPEPALAPVGIEISSEPRRLVTAHMEIEEHLIRIFALKLIGMLDNHANTGLKLRAHSLLVKGVNRFVVDLSEVGFVDSAGLSALMGTLQQLSQRGAHVKLASGSHGGILQILAQPEFEQTVEVYQDVQAALDSFAPLPSAGS